ncbi:hypothetical protein AB0D49_32100 [Streptomyces sp. NPDC048290]|uniref:hypothetical protein n=1 Tax=Streptomyces sp. NPDC048290 TaxID=3155811 RepID=UPI0034244774
MTHQDLRPLDPPAGHPTWWRAPLVASVVAGPLLVAEYALFVRDGGGSPLGVWIYGGALMLLVSWGLPRRASLRSARRAAAGAGLGCALLPVLFAVLFGLAIAVSS